MLSARGKKRPLRKKPPWRQNPGFFHSKPILPKGIACSLSFYSNLVLPKRIAGASCSLSFSFALAFHSNLVLPKRIAGASLVLVLLLCLLCFSGLTCLHLNSECDCFSAVLRISSNWWRTNCCCSLLTQSTEFLAKRLQSRGQLPSKDMPSFSPLFFSLHSSPQHFPTLPSSLSFLFFRRIVFTFPECCRDDRLPCKEGICRYKFKAPPNRRKLNLASDVAVKMSNRTQRSPRTLYAGNLIENSCLKRFSTIQQADNCNSCPMLQCFSRNSLNSLEFLVKLADFIEATFFPGVCFFFAFLLDKGFLDSKRETARASERERECECVKNRNSAALDSRLHWQVTSSNALNHVTLCELWHERTRCWFYHVTFDWIRAGRCREEDFSHTLRHFSDIRKGRDTFTHICVQQSHPRKSPWNW